jgi:hypothetical protein
MPSHKTAQFRVTLAEKPTDLLVHLVDHGPASSQELVLVFKGKGSLYSGGLNVLRELGLAEGPRNEHDQLWRATDEGRRLIEQARPAGGPAEVSRCCGAGVKPTGDAEGTVFYVCLACGGPTDVR